MIEGGRTPPAVDFAPRAPTQDIGAASRSRRAARELTERIMPIRHYLRHAGERLLGILLALVLAFVPNAAAAEVFGAASVPSVESSAAPCHETAQHEPGKGQPPAGEDCCLATCVAVAPLPTAALAPACPASVPGAVPAAQYRAIAADVSTPPPRLR